MSSSQKLTLLAIIVGHFGTLCVATTFPLSTSMRQDKACSIIDQICSELDGSRDCLIPKFICFRNMRCIPLSSRCDGIDDCEDGSDEWRCGTASSDSTTSTMVSESVDDTTMLPGNEEKTTYVILPESEEKTSSSIIRSTTLSYSESNTVASSSTTTSTMLPDSESNTGIPSSTTSTRLPDSQLNTAPSTSTTTSKMFPNSDSSSATTKTMIPDSESNTSHSSFVTDSTMLPHYEEKTSYPTTNSIFSDSRVVQPCPDNHCMQNAECVVVGNEYRCKCPSSFVGKLCEVQLGTEQVSHEYVETIVIIVTLVILCVPVVSVGIYRYKRFSAWKSSDRTSRTLSQLTLTSNAVEQSFVSISH